MSSVSALYCLWLVIAPERLSSVTTWAVLRFIFAEYMRDKLRSSVFAESVFAESL